MRQIIIASLGIALGACSAGGDQRGDTVEPAAVADHDASAEPTQAPEGAGPLVTPALTRTASAADVPTGRTTCRNIIGWLRDNAPEGRNVRAGPTVNARRIAVLPPPLTSDQVPNWDRPLPVSFDIIGSENGWLQIRGAEFDESLAGQPVPRVFDGEGWISGRVVYVGLQTRAAFAAPTHDSAVLISGDYLDGWPQRGVAACQDQWVLVDWGRPPPSPSGAAFSWADAAIINRSPFILRGWAAGVCNIIETTCDGVDGTAAESAFRD